MKILCINIGNGDGIVYYANNIIKNLNLPKEIWISSTQKNKYKHPDKILNLKTGSFNMLWQTIFILPKYLGLIILNIIRKKYQSVIVFGPHLWDSFFIGLFKCFNLKAYYVVHDGIMHTGEVSKIHQKSLILTMQYSSNLIFLSENVKNLVKKNLNINKPSIIIPHGIINYSSSDHKDLKKLRDKPIFLMIGRINYYKGINILLDSLKYIDFENIGEIIIAGKFSKAVIYEDLKNKYPKVSLINKWLSSTEFDNLVTEADFILMPYIEATQSGVASVSIGYCTPAIVTKVGAMEEQFGSEAAYFLNTLTPKDLADMINIVKHDSGNYLKKQLALQERATELSWEELAKNLQEYIKADLN